MGKKGKFSCGDAVCVYVCLSVSKYLWIYGSMYLWIYGSMYLCIYVSMYLCIYGSMDLCIYVSMCMYVYVYVNVNGCVCMYVPWIRPQDLPSPKHVEMPQLNLQGLDPVIHAEHSAKCCLAAIKRHVTRVT